MDGLGELAVVRAYYRIDSRTMTVGCKLLKLMSAASCRMVVKVGGWKESMRSWAGDFIRSASVVFYRESDSPARALILGLAKVN